MIRRILNANLRNKKPFYPETYPLIQWLNNMKKIVLDRNSYHLLGQIDKGIASKCKEYDLLSYIQLHPVLQII